MYSDKLPDITRRFESLLVYSNLTSDSIVSGRATDMIFDFSIGNPFSIEPQQPNFRRKIITDTLLKPVDLNRISVQWNEELNNSRWGLLGKVFEKATSEQVKQMLNLCVLKKRRSK